jgi:hypothetical protein
MATETFVPVECPLDSTPLGEGSQYVLVPGGENAFCLNCAVALIAQAYEGDYLQGLEITNIQQLWETVNTITFASIGY